MIYIRHISLPGKLKMTSYFSFDFTINPNMFLIFFIANLKLFQIDSSSLHPTALVLCTHSYVYMHPDSLVCECMLPKQRCLWALAWPNRLSLTPLDMMSFVCEIHRVVHNPPSPPHPTTTKTQTPPFKRRQTSAPHTVNRALGPSLCSRRLSSLVSSRRAGMMNHPPIPITELAEHTELLKANDNLKLSQEYEVS